MELVVEDFNDNPSQQCDFNNHVRHHIVRIALWVYANNIGDAHTFRFFMEDEDTNIVFDQTLTGAEIKTKMDKSLTYFHGKLFLEIDDDILLLRNGTYTFTVDQLTGYTGSTYLSWCKDWERPYDATNSSPANASSAPFYIRFYDKKGVQL